MCDVNADPLFNLIKFDLFNLITRSEILILEKKSITSLKVVYQVKASHLSLLMLKRDVLALHR